MFTKVQYLCKCTKTELVTGFSSLKQFKAQCELSELTEVIYGHYQELITQLLTRNVTHVQVEILSTV